ncbi:ComEA family DNA-binding protein [Bacterioplanoides sp. SCSIO 12839]|uniref:ComEA family DNA-binding protein n=1 Tax=Bacterioplanoides sp. SCSIO 12839 TaxID=2829569 RepID=UPI0021FAC4B1|nr:ComEA family DNA-binding protein [Bacterioplanoides sp. SCSIO 12839]
MKWIKTLAFTTALALAPLSHSDDATQPEQASININTASAEELAELDGIGKSKAEAIVSYRENMGNFTSVEELVLVKGIGEGILEKNRALLATSTD